MFAEPLMATCWTTAGDAAPDRVDLRSPLPLRDRVEAAARAGFRGFGLLSADLPGAEREYGMSGIATLFADNGITDIELEGIPGWWSGHGDAQEVRDLLLRAAEALGARHVKVTPDTSGDPWDRSHWVTEFGRLAAQAADSGARLGIEFLPWANIATLADGMWLVEQAGHPAGGLVIDTWHTERGHTPVEELADVPLDRIVGVELDDADAEVVGSLFEDTVHRRRYPGEGSFDLTGAVGALRRAGWRGPWGIEILSDDHRSLPLGAAVEKAVRTTLEVLDPSVPAPEDSSTG